MTDPARVLVIDHRDSFVFNLADELARRGAQVRTLRCDTKLPPLLDQVAAFDPHLVLLSPGPGRPEDAGVTPAFLRTRPRIPVLGVCLGHQAIAVAAGGRVARAPGPVHGEAWQIDLGRDPIFDGLPGRFPAARYHSLVVTEVPPALRVIATCRHAEQDLVMAVRHRELPQLGFQFHPESFLTPLGGELLGRVLVFARAFRASVPIPSVPPRS